MKKQRKKSNLRQNNILTERKKQMKVKVKSLNTGPRHGMPTCSCSSWIVHWNQNRYPSRSNVAGFCRACNTKFEPSDLVGGHVLKVSSSDQNRYIVPLCYSCNNKDPFEFEVDLVDMISANCDNCANG